MPFPHHYTESLLRYGLPITNKEIRDIQSSVESIQKNLKVPFSELCILQIILAFSDVVPICARASKRLLVATEISTLAAC
jgi:hypothetical protein